jgi:thiosulfate dehydrogenase (quinone) large subunit
MQPKSVKITGAILRFVMGLTFLWPFLDKLFGLGYSTKPGGAWIAGGSPSAGFLGKATGPFSPFFKAIAGAGIIDWLFMLCLLLVGLALLLGIGMRVAAISGSILMALMWAAALPKTGNFFQLDDHTVYILVILLLAFIKAGQYGGFGRLWARTSLVKKAPWLE